MEFVAPSDEVLEEVNEVSPVPVDPAVAPPTVSSVPAIATDEDLLAVELPDHEHSPDVEDIRPDVPESEFLPDSPNHPEWPQPDCFLRPGEEYSSLTEYQFIAE